MSLRSFNALSQFKLDCEGNSLFVRGDGIDIEVKDGQVFVRNGTVTLSGGGRLIDRPVPANIKIGMRMEDGTVYAGVSPDTGKPMYVMPQDAPLTVTFNDAVKHVVSLRAHGHNDWRVPGKDELDQLYQNHWMIGGFNTAGKGLEGFYWSSTPTDFLSSSVWAQRFSNGYQHKCHAGDTAQRSLRCVRG